MSNIPNVDDIFDSNLLQLDGRNDEGKSIHNLQGLRIPEDPYHCDFSVNSADLTRFSPWSPPQPYSTDSLHFTHPFPHPFMEYCCED